MKAQGAEIGRALSALYRAARFKIGKDLFATGLAQGHEVDQCVPAGREEHVLGAVQCPILRHRATALQKTVVLSRHCAVEFDSFLVHLQRPLRQETR